MVNYELPCNRGDWGGGGGKTVIRQGSYHPMPSLLNQLRLENGFLYKTVKNDFETEITHANALSLLISKLNKESHHLISSNVGERFPCSELMHLQLVTCPVSCLQQNI